MREVDDALSLRVCSSVRRPGTPSAATASVRVHLRLRTTHREEDCLAWLQMCCETRSGSTAAAGGKVAGARKPGLAAGLASEVALPASLGEQSTRSSVVSSIYPPYHAARTRPAQHRCRLSCTASQVMNNASPMGFQQRTVHVTATWRLPRRGCVRRICSTTIVLALPLCEALEALTHKYNDGSWPREYGCIE
jgi:hypothetical protein